MPKHKPQYTSPVLRAVLAQKWEQTALIAQIQALMGGDPDRIADQAGRVIFVILGASILDGVSAEDPDVRIVRGAAGALYDLAGADSVPDQQRGAVISGLQACARLCEVLKRKSMTDAAVDLHFAFKTGHLHWSAFEGVGVVA